MSSQAPHIFSPEYYRRLGWVEEQHPWSKHVQRLALALLDRFGGGSMARVLDAGCGAGYFTLLWREQSRPRLAVGLDSSLDGLILCRGRGLHDVIAGSVAALSFRSGAFDAVYCADVLQHLDAGAAAQTLGEFARVLRPGGLLLIRTAARRGIGSKKHRDAADYQQWEPAKLGAALEPCALRIEWMSLVNWLPSLAADLRAYRQPAPVGDVGLHVAASPMASHGGGLGQSLLSGYWAAERLALLRLRWRLPGGHTLLCVARKL
ncbi:MAG TPA: class I SAM-dependent methyltransferase [Bryobacterales bacterium]|nr:class I SAM-dependent methyltransferase [Bryobacterales bacterium]